MIPDLLDLLARYVECAACPCFLKCKTVQPKSCKWMLARRLLVEIAEMMTEGDWLNGRE